MANNSRRYYYTASVASACSQDGLKHFIALTKKQVKQYLISIHCPAETVFDPTHKPAAGIYYHNICDFKTT